MRELEAEIHKMSMNGEKELMALKIELERLRIRYVTLAYLFTPSNRLKSNLLTRIDISKETRDQRSSKDWAGKDDGEYHGPPASDPSSQGAYRGQDSGGKEVCVEYAVGYRSRRSIFVHSHNPLYGLSCMDPSFHQLVSFGFSLGPLCLLMLSRRRLFHA